MVCNVRKGVSLSLLVALILLVMSYGFRLVYVADHLDTGKCQTACEALGYNHSMSGVHLTLKPICICSNVYACPIDIEKSLTLIDGAWR